MSVFYMQTRTRPSLDFDHSSGHNSFGPDALVANGMNVHPGGKQPKMRDTVMPNGKLQLMVDSDGVPKGLNWYWRNVVREDMVKVLSHFQDFREERLAVYTSYLNHEILFYIFAQAKYIFAFHIWWRRQQHLKLPCHMQFHPELNPIERCWAKAKQHAAPTALFPASNELLNGHWSIALEQVCKHFRKVRDYHRAYMAGKSALEAETIVLDDKSVKTVLEHPQIMCFTQSLGQSHLPHLALHT